jgi:hypothetical protein
MGREIARGMNKDGFVLWRLSPQLNFTAYFLWLHDTFPELGLIGQLMPLGIVSSLVTMVDSILKGAIDIHETPSAAAGGNASIRSAYHREKGKDGREGDISKLLQNAHRLPLN